MKSVSKIALVAAALGFVMTTETASARDWSRTSHLRQHHGGHHQERHEVKQENASEEGATNASCHEHMQKVEELEKEVAQLKEDLAKEKASYDKAEERLDETEQHAAMVTDALGGLLTKKTIEGMDMKQHHKQLPVFEEAIKAVRSIVDEISAQEKEAEQNKADPDKKEEAEKQLHDLKEHGVLKIRNRMTHHVIPVLNAIVDAIKKSH